MTPTTENKQIWTKTQKHEKGFLSSIELMIYSQLMIKILISHYLIKNSSLILSVFNCLYHLRESILKYALNLNVKIRFLFTHICISWICEGGFTSFKHLFKVFRWPTSIISEKKKKKQISLWLLQEKVWQLDRGPIL